jgi:hypothetical protein
LERSIVTTIVWVLDSSPAPQFLTPLGWNRMEYGGWLAELDDLFDVKRPRGVNGGSGATHCLKYRIRYSVLGARSNGSDIQCPVSYLRVSACIYNLGSRVGVLFDCCFSSLLSRMMYRTSAALQNRN